MCLLLDMRKTNKMRAYQSLQVQRNLIKSIHESSLELNLNTEILDLRLFSSTDVARYNDYCMLSNWFNEMCVHPSDHYIPYSSVYTNNIIEKYGTPYFAWIAIYDEQRSGGQDFSCIEFYLFDLRDGTNLFSKREIIKDESDIDKPLVSILQQIKNQN